MNEFHEQAFQLLSRKNGEPFESAIVENWYKARTYVLNKLKDVAFGPDSEDHLHVVIMGDSPLLLSVARQVALSAHFINYDEENEDENQRKRTVITILSQDDEIERKLTEEEYLCNLPKYCKSVIYGVEKNKGSYVDIELQVIKDRETSDENCCLEITEEEVVEFCKLHVCNGIDTRKAVFANRIYDLGALISNVPYEDIHDARRYSQALDAFIYIQLKKPWHSMFNEDQQKDLTKVKEALSNVFCSDCFETREREVRKLYKNDRENLKKHWEKCNKTLSVSEHARWVTEKLIMGYRPLNDIERVEDERAIATNKMKNHRNRLKKNSVDPAHIDLCSYADLRRIDPDNLKYDSFMMLAIPDILKKLKEDE